MRIHWVASLAQPTLLEKREEEWVWVRCECCVSTVFPTGFDAAARTVLFRHRRLRSNARWLGDLPYFSSRLRGAGRQWDLIGVGLVVAEISHGAADESHRRSKWDRTEWRQIKTDRQPIQNSNHNASKESQWHETERINPIGHCREEKRGGGRKERDSLVNASSKKGKEVKRTWP